MKVTQQHLGGALLLALALALAGAARADSIRQIKLTTKDLIYDPHTKKIYASVPSSAGSRGNSLTPLDPVTGVLGASVFVGSEPGKLAIADDGQYIYVGLDGAAAVRRFNVAAQTPELQFALGSDPFFGPYTVADIEVLPGQPASVAISRSNTGFSPQHAGVAIYDDGVQRPNVTQRHTGSNVIAFSSTAARLYGYNNETTEFGFRRLNVTSSGVAELSVTSNLISGFGADIKFDGGRIYASTGAIIDPEARTLLGTCVFSGSNAAVRPDAASRRVFYAVGTGSSVRLLAFDSSTFLEVGALTVPGAVGIPGSLLRWGRDGLAFRTSSNQVFLVQGAIVAPPPALTLSVTPGTFRESAGSHAATATLTRNTPPDNPLDVTLASDDTTEATVPPTITIPAGATSVTFPVAAQNDTVADGPQTVQLTAQAAGLGGAQTTVTVTDNEARLALAVAPTTFSEAAGPLAAIGTVTRNTPTTAPLTVTLLSKDRTEATAPPTVTIPAGADSANFPIDAINDPLADGPQTVRLVASVSGFVPAAADVTVLDNDVPALSLRLSRSAIPETAGPGAAMGTVKRNTPTTAALIVTLASNDAAEARVPATVTIPAGAASATFLIDAVDDSVADGAKSVTITASAAGFISSQRGVVVTDNEVEPFRSMSGAAVAPARAPSD